MSAAERDLGNFNFDDNVNELGGGALVELSERAGIETNGGLTVDRLGQLVGVLGKNKGLRDNPDITFLTVP